MAPPKQKKAKKMKIPKLKWRGIGERARGILRDLRGSLATVRVVNSISMHDLQNFNMLNNKEHFIATLTKKELVAETMCYLWTIGYANIQTEEDEEEEVEDIFDDQEEEVDDDEEEVEEDDEEEVEEDDEVEEDEESDDAEEDGKREEGATAAQQLHQVVPTRHTWVGPCGICKARVPAYIFTVCRCLGVCENCRASLLWRSGDKVPPTAREILDNLRAKCPREGCDQWCFGRDIQAVNFIN